MLGLWLNVVAVWVMAFVTAALFRAYLPRGLLMVFANRVLWGLRTVASSPPPRGRRFC
jgi:hypothetical protein